MSERGAAEHHGEQPGSLLLRAGRTDITPPLSGPLAGYEARGDGVSDGTLDALEAALVVLDDSSSRIAWLAVDSIAVTERLAVRLRHAVRDGLGDEGVHVVTVASHTHAAPRAWVGSIHPGHRGEVDEEWVAALVDSVRALAEAVARRAAESVTGHWGEGLTAGFAANRLDPRAPYRGDAGVLTLRAVDDGSVRAVVFDLANHPTVLGPSNMSWSADWPGAARAAIRAGLETEARQSRGAVAEQPVVLFLQGAAGDVSSRFTRRGADESEVRRLGALAADAVLRAATAPELEVRGSLRVVARVLTIGRRDLPTQDDARRALDDATTARNELSGVPALDPRVRLAQSRIDGARVQTVLVTAALPDRVEFPISVIAWGEIAWIHVPVEVFTSIGELIREASPFPVTRVIGYTDGYLGYLADRSAHTAGSYEALSSLFPPDAAETVVHEALEILKEIR